MFIGARITEFFLGLCPLTLAYIYAIDSPFSQAGMAGSRHTELLYPRSNLYYTRGVCNDGTDDFFDGMDPNRLRAAIMRTFDLATRNPDPSYIFKKVIDMINAPDTTKMMIDKDDSPSKEPVPSFQRD